MCCLAPAEGLYRGMPSDAYFQGDERIMNDDVGRPHWGKLLFQDHRSLPERYPEWDLFPAVRAELGPSGRFANSYLDRVLGPPALPGAVRADDLDETGEAVGAVTGDDAFGRQRLGQAWYVGARANPLVRRARRSRPYR